MNTTTMTLPQFSLSCQPRDNKGGSNSFAKGFNHTSQCGDTAMASFADDIMFHRLLSSVKPGPDSKSLQSMEGESDFEENFSESLTSAENTNSEDSLSIWPNPIDSSRIHVVNSLPLTHPIFQAPENNDTLYEFLGQLFRGHHDTSPYSQSMSYCVETKAPQDYIAPPATISPSTSACLSSMSSPTSSSNKRSMTGASELDPLPHQNKRQRIAPLENFGVDTMDEGSEPPSPCIPFKPQPLCQWGENFKALCEFRENHGHCNVPPKFNNDPSLWRWIKRQRYQYKLKQEGRKPRAISDDRIAALEGIGFVWDSQGTLWMERLDELAEFRRIHGHCNVPSKYPANKKLSTWVKCQRRQFKLYHEDSSKSNMTEERIKALDELGFVFEPRVGGKPEE